MRQQTLEPPIFNQLNFLPNSPIPLLLPSDNFPLDDAIEQTRQLLNHTGSDAELLLKVQAISAAIHILCLDVTS